ncbi:MAG: hypothetical protein SVM86_02980 [Candidatus Cloacimonadota bacterium]|nr:hypothetical protein [Candidatus Cloacimonadota bacterium]
MSTKNSTISPSMFIKKNPALTGLKRWEKVDTIRTLFMNLNDEILKKI